MLNPKLLTFLRQSEHNKKIQQWRQDIENRRAKNVSRTPKSISVREAKRCFMRGVQTDRSPYAKEAELLLRKLLKTPPIIAFFRNQADPGNQFSEEGPRVKIGRAVAHFEMQARRLRGEFQNCPPGPQLNLLKQQTALYSGLALTLTETRARMDADRIIEQLSINPALTLPPYHPVVKAYKDYEKLIRQAAKCGLGSDPYVRNWVGNHEYPRDSQNRKIKPIPESELPIYNAIDTLRGQGYFWRQVHRELMKRKLIKMQSWQSFHRWITRRDMQALYGLDA